MLIIAVLLFFACIAQAQSPNASDTRNIIFNDGDETEDCMLTDLIVPCCITAEPRKDIDVRSIVKPVFDKECKNRPVVKLTPETIDIGDKDSVTKVEITASFKGKEIKKKITVVNPKFEAEDKDKTKELNQDMTALRKQYSEKLKEVLKKALGCFTIRMSPRLWEPDYAGYKVYYHYVCCTDKKNSDSCVKKSYTYKEVYTSGYYPITMSGCVDVDALPEKTKEVIQKYAFINIYGISFINFPTTALNFQLNGCDPPPDYCKPVSTKRPLSFYCVLQPYPGSGIKNDTVRIRGCTVNVTADICFYPKVKMCMTVEMEKCSITGKLKTGEKGKETEVDIEIPLSNGFKTEKPVCF
jgi:hypothetical protein